MVARIASRRCLPVVQWVRRKSIGSATNYLPKYATSHMPATQLTTLKSNGFRIASENWNTPTCTVALLSAVELLSDILKNSKFESNQIERERGVILREMEEIESIDHTQLADLAEKHFGDFPASYGKEGIPSIESCRFTGSEIRDRDDAMPLAHAAIAFEGPGWTNPDTLALMVASSIHGAWDRSYGGGTNVASKLAAQFFSEDSVHSFQHFFTCYHDTSLWGVYLTAEKLGLADGVNAFMKEFVRMCTQITPHEVERAKNQLKTHLLLQLDGTTPVCEEIGRHILVYGRRIPLTEMLERIDLLRTEHIRDTCMKYFYDHCPAVTSLGPIETMPDYNRIRDQTWWLRL
ncbi:mitochondrial-processing peptidase subunit beta [Paragonimus westermani]|uniref:Mitochondrial-processing peptidase subunit beta n=1 Tax=Paragonimus westermani TaxID=34504 RepID=A0A5J4NLT5_9TREM|nr:mitochondrial-processing peptidase subunit beta [Paragonimus westermani]